MTLDLKTLVASAVTGLVTGLLTSIITVTEVRKDVDWLKDFRTEITLTYQSLEARVRKLEIDRY